jgi:hypothetical protein
MSNQFNSLLIDVYVFRLGSIAYSSPISVIIDFGHLYLKLLESFLKQGLPNFGDGISLEDDL